MSIKVSLLPTDPNMHKALVHIHNLRYIINASKKIICGTLTIS